MHKKSGFQRKDKLSISKHLPYIREHNTKLLIIDFSHGIVHPWHVGISARKKLAKDI